MVVGGSKEARTVVLCFSNFTGSCTISTILFQSKGHFKLAFEKRKCKIIVDKFMRFLLILKLDFSTGTYIYIMRFSGSAEAHHHR